MSSIALPTLSDGRSLAAYLREIRSFPILTSEEEFMLARRWHDYGDADAAHQLVTSHLRLVVKIASQYRKYALPFADLISEGSIGLMKAVQRFDPEKGFRLATYAMWWIKAEITGFILRSWSMVRIGSAALQKRLFFSLRRARARLENFEDGAIGPALDERLAEEFGMTADELRYFSSRLENRDVSLDQPLNEFEDGEGMARLDLLANNDPDPESHVATAEERRYRRRVIEAVISELPARDQEIIKARWLGESRLTLEALGRRFGVSRERVRQLEERALKRVKAGVCELLGTESPAEIGAALLTA